MPCRLCWFQRIAMYPLAVILLVAAIRRDRGVRWYADPARRPSAPASRSTTTSSSGIPQLEGDACDPANPCSLVWFREFGFVTLSFMALCGFVAIIALLLAGRRPGTRRRVRSTGARDGSSAATPRRRPDPDARC